jgi:hypothetical protein
LSQHSKKIPDDCPKCRALFPLIKARFEAGGDRLTVTEIQSGVGIGERAQRLHLAALVEHRRIEPDRYTPVPGAQVGPVELDVLSPWDWLATVQCPDRTCKRLLTLYVQHADRTMTGQLSVDEAAAALGTSVRTVVRHRAHLTDPADGHPLVRFEQARERLESGRYASPPSRYVLLSAPQELPAGRSWHEDAAHDVLAQVRWWASADRAVRQRAVTAILACLRRGWTPAQLLARLDVEPRSAVTSPLGLLRALLPDGEPYTPAAPAVATEPVHCPGCGTKYPAHVKVPTGHVCRACRAERAELAAAIAEPKF